MIKTLKTIKTEFLVVSPVLLTGGSTKGGEIYVLDMGEPVKIVTLARNLICLSGDAPDVEVEKETKLFLCYLMRRYVKQKVTRSKRNVFERR